jgi:CzcA family heavy metal efflux pump
MILSAFVERQRRAILLVMAALTLGGVFAAFALPVGLYPQTTFPRVRVTIDSGARPASETVLQTTIPVEQALRAIPGVQDIRSSTSRGSTQIFVDYPWGTNIAQAVPLVDAALSQTLPELPPGTTYTVLPMTPNSFAFISYALTSPKVPQSRLWQVAQLQIVPLLSGIPGVARVQVVGGAPPEAQVLVDPAKLAAFHVTLAQVGQAVTNANVLSAVGRLQDQDRLYLLVQDNSVATLAALKAIVVRAGADGVVRLGQVADVRMGTVPQFVAVAEDSKPAVTFEVFQQEGSDALAVARAVNAALAKFSAQLPPGTKLTQWYNQPALVTAAAGSVRDAIVIGVLLATLVVLIFLRNARVTLVAMLVVPASLATSVLVLSALGMSFNIMTLGGMAASVGLVIDDAIVMIEHIARRVGQGRKGLGRATVLPAAAEFLPPLTGSSLATLIVFAPLAFLSGVSGAFFKALSITMAATLAVSWLFSAFALPVLARGLIDFERWHDPLENEQGRLGRWHARLLDRLIRRPALVLVGVLPLLVAGALAYTHVPTGFMPDLDEGGFVLDYQTAPGTSLIESVREINEIEAILHADPAVATFSRRTGTGLGGDLNEPNHGDMFVKLKPLSERAPIWTVMDRVSAAINAKVPGVQFDTAQLMSDELGDLTGVPQPIEIKLAGDDPALVATALKVADAISKIPGVDGVDNGLVLAGDSIDIHVDQAKAAMLGLDPGAISATLSTALTGSVVTEMPGPLRFTGVRVWLDPDQRRFVTDLAKIPIQTQSGALVPLGSIASFHTVSGEPEIDRDNLQRIVAVTGRIEGRGIGAAIADVKATLARPGLLPRGMTYSLGGLYQQQQIAFIGLAKVFVAALAAEFVLLVFLYRSLLLAAAIVVTAMISTAAVFIGLFVAGVALNITALMGMTMIVGIGTEMAIFFVSAFDELRADLPVDEALRQAASNRLRPIAMTTLAAILTLLPLALDLGQGAGMQQPLAVAIIAGLLAQFPMVLLALPAALRVVLSRS